MNFLLFLGLFLFSCEKDQDCGIAQRIEGKWEWIQSVGGIGGWTLTPESEKKTMTLYLNDFKYKLFENDQLILEKPYQLIIQSGAAGEPSYVLQLEFGNLIPYFRVQINRNRLILTEDCFDCFEHTYIRSK